MKEQPRTVHRSMQGKEIDMNKLITQNEMIVAVGNARMNARGDELGPGGKIIKKREEIIREKSNRVPSQPIAKKTEEQNITVTSPTPGPVTDKTTKVISKRKTQTEGNK